MLSERMYRQLHMTELYLISGALLMSATLVAAFRNAVAGTVCAYAGAWALRASGYSPIPSTLLMSWAIAVILVISIEMARRTPQEIPHRLRYYITGGALAGMAAGLAFYQAGAILGSAAGVILATVAYSRINRGRTLRQLWPQAVAAGFPAIVTMSVVALGIQGILAKATGF